MGCSHLLAIASDAAVNSCEWDFVRACVVRSRAHHDGFLVTVFSCECWTTFFAFLPQECKQECELAIADLQSSREEEAGLQQSQVTRQGPHRLAAWSLLSPQGTAGIQVGGADAAISSLCLVCFHVLCGGPSAGRVEETQVDARGQGAWSGAGHVSDTLTSGLFALPISCGAPSGCTQYRHTVREFGVPVLRAVMGCGVTGRGAGWRLGGIRASVSCPHPQGMSAVALSVSSLLILIHASVSP